LQNSDFIVIAARPSMGKTSLALNVAEHVAVNEGLPVAVFSLEMSREQLVMRMLCTLARVNAHKVRTGFLTQEDFDELVKAAGKLAEAPIYIDDTPGISVMEIRAKARRLKMKNDVRLVIIDYMQLMQSTRRTENRQQEISEISRALKALAREINVPVMVLSQLNRAVETRTDHRPQLSDLRESGAIEQDADVVLMLLRREYYDPEDSPGTADLIISKQRNGPTGEIRLMFHDMYTRFDDFTEREEPEFGQE
jgi:replicative DNA helicase